MLHITWGARILAHGWLSGYGQSYPIDTAWVTGCRRLLGSPPVHTRPGSPLAHTRPGSPPAHTQLTLISWVASGAHPTHLDFLGRLRLTANTQLHFQSVMPTLSCTQPAAHAQHTPQPMLFVYCVRC